MIDEIHTCTELDIVPNPVNETAVAFLREALAKAESGELHGFVLCGEVVGGEMWTVETVNCPVAMIGQLEFAKARILFTRMEAPPDAEGDPPDELV